MKKRRMLTTKTNMKRRKQDFFTYLPSDIVNEILSRLPAQTILSCKCVCKWWHDLVETRDFAKSHLSKSVTGLALTVLPNTIDRNIEFTLVLDPQHTNLHDLYFNTITTLNFKYLTRIQGSADGLLLLETLKSLSTEIHLCNPITREYIDLRSNIRLFDPKYPGRMIVYGFGVSKITGQYKAVMIFHYRKNINPLSRHLESDCKVYTIGTGSWRSIAPHAPVRHIYKNKGAFVNGNLHWLVQDLNETPLVSCFDLETELFSTFPPPPLQNDKRKSTNVVLVVVEGILCLCDGSSGDGRVIIWLMKEYGIEKSWTNELVVADVPYIRSLLVYPIRISKDGVILMASNHESLFYYSRENKNIHRIGNFNKRVYVTSISHVPSVLPLNNFKMENSFTF